MPLPREFGGHEAGHPRSVSYAGEEHTQPHNCHQGKLWRMNDRIRLVAAEVMNEGSRSVAVTPLPARRLEEHRSKEGGRRLQSSRLSDTRGKDFCCLNGLLSDLRDGNRLEQGSESAGAQVEQEA